MYFYEYLQIKMQNKTEIQWIEIKHLKAKQTIRQKQNDTKTEKTEYQILEMTFKESSFTEYQEYDNARTVYSSTENHRKQVDSRL